jgi:hypothetical protein
MIALVLALAVISACLIPWAIRADGDDYHLAHLTDCPDCNHEMSKP